MVNTTDWGGDSVIGVAPLPVAFGLAVVASVVSIPAASAAREAPTATTTSLV